MKCIVTGGCGFLGSHLAEKLVKNGHHVIVIDSLISGRKKNINQIKNKITFVHSDINNKKKIKKYFNNVDWVFHLAALADIVPSIQRPADYFKSNVEGTLNILELVKKSKKLKKFIYIASSSSYGIPKKYPTSEKNKIDPQYPYALTKHMGEELVMHWGKVYKLPVISLRCFNIYGTRSRTSGAYGAVMGVFLAQKINKKPFTIVGDGHQRRDFTFVSDVVDAIYFFVKSRITNDVFNIGSGKTVSVNHIVNLLGKNKKTYLPKRPGEPLITFADISKVKKLGWKPKIDIKKGISILLNNISYWHNAPVWNKKKIRLATQDWFKFLGK
jgi:UDP-glucose 4-epimerase